ncbi:MAG: DUF6918 family protein [Persicimonas sp.]
MGVLEERLKSTERSEVVDAVVDLIDAEVKRKKGLSGMALKGGYKVVKRMKNGRMIHKAADGLLDPFARALEPLYQDYLDDESYASFEAYLADHRDEATEALLSITDDRAEKADHKVLKKTYGKLRGQAVDHVRDALPATGRLIDKYAPRQE